MDAAIYTRISHDPKADDADDGGKGVARQETDCRELVERAGWTVGAKYEDNDVSAYNGKRRPRFEALLEALRRGQHDVLVCWHTDRLYRSVRDMERVIEVCEAAGVPIRTVNGGDLDLTTATGKAIARILGSVAHMEVEHKSERQVRAHVQRADAGTWWSSRRVFGYTKHGEVMEAEARLIRKAAADVLDGKSLSQVAREWDAAGKPTPQEKGWTPSAVKRVLVNPRHAGQRVYKGKIVGPGEWEAIVDADTHGGVVAILRDKARGRGAVSYERKYLGSFRYRCGVCDAPMERAVSTHADGRSFSRYRCSKSTHLSRSQTELDGLVEAMTLGYLKGSNPTLHKRLAEETVQVDLPGLRTRRAALAETMDELATLRAEGVLTSAAVRRESAKIAGRMQAIDDELAEAARNNPAAKFLADGPEHVEERWAALSPDMQGKLIDECFVVVVHPSPKGRYFRPECIEFRPVT